MPAGGLCLVMLCGVGRNSPATAGQLVQLLVLQRGVQVGQFISLLQEAEVVRP